MNDDPTWRQGDTSAAPCKLYTVTFEAWFDITVAAPVDMPVAEVRALINKHKARLVEEEAGVADWDVSVPSPEDGDAGDTDRHTWVVSDSRQDFVCGEETDWLPESG
jgi:hypothetical protein